MVALMAERRTCGGVCWGRGICARPVALQGDEAWLPLSHELLYRLRVEQVLRDIHILWSVHLQDCRVILLPFMQS